MDKVRAFFRSPVAKVLVLGALLLWAARTCQSGPAHAEVTLILGHDAAAVTSLRADVIAPEATEPAAYSVWPRGPTGDTASFELTAEPGTYNVVLTIEVGDQTQTFTRTVKIHERADVQVDIADAVSKMASVST